MNILMTPSRLDLLAKASPTGIAAVNAQTLADLQALANAGLLEQDFERVFHLTGAGRRCLHVNVGGAADEPAVSRSAPVSACPRPGAGVPPGPERAGSRLA